MPEERKSEDNKRKFLSESQEGDNGLLIPDLIYSELSWLNPPDPYAEFNRNESEVLENLRKIHARDDSICLPTPTKKNKIEVLRDLSSNHMSLFNREVNSRVDVGTKQFNNIENKSPA